jgi:uncharacterized membrane protein
MVEILLSDSNNAIVRITNTLDYFTIKHVVATVPKTAIDQLPEYFIAQVSDGSASNIVFVSKTPTGEIIAQVDENTQVTISKEEFVANWTGFVLAIEKSETAQTIKKSKTFILNTILIGCLFIGLSYIAILTHSLYKIGYMFLSISGFIISGFIIKEKLGLETITSKFCTLSKNTNCQAVLNSKEAILFKDVDLSDISIVYFSFLTIAFMIAPNSLLFFFLSIGSLPAILYSLYYQNFKIRSWCPLCLGIVAVLLLQFLVQLPIYEELHFDYKTIPLFGCIIGLLIIGWISGKSLLSTKRENKTLRIENLTFRRNHNLFIPYYRSLKKIDTSLAGILPIKIGVSNPIVTLSIITNPLCKMCSEAHKVYMDVLEKYPNEVQITFRFLVPHANPNDTKTQVSERLMQLYFEDGGEAFIHGYEEWYKKESIEEWFDTWGKCSNVMYNNILKKQVTWCLSQGIDSSPAVLINEKLFPQSYHPTDIANFIEPIITFEKNAIKNNTNNIHA